MEPIPSTLTAVEFGRFSVLAHRRELLADGRAVKLGGRAFDVLMALIEARGAVVSKDALMARVWPDRIVEENHLQVQIVALRKAFGSGRELIRTVSGRGYQFTSVDGSEAVARAEEEFLSALNLARRQVALSWELRAATSLARLLRDQGRSADATALLKPVYDRFTEGFATADLKAAKALLDDLS